MAAYSWFTIRTTAWRYVWDLSCGANSFSPPGAQDEVSTRSQPSGQQGSHDRSGFAHQLRSCEGEKSAARWKPVSNENRY